ncbi:hypothetical protein VTJ04DRAFT_7374 [Mycothermus thermophilus]|uniref:uncharacterized protein n=1 Tax=Humicola insolens TaxID=85995 RepID=UPI003741F0EA
MSQQQDRTAAIEIDGRVYHPRRPASEQTVVGRITKRLQPLDHLVQLGEAAKDELARRDPAFSEEDFRAFATIYPRLYQVQAKNRSRIESWISRHQDLVNIWNVEGFLNSPEQDQGCEICKPRNPSNTSNRPG